MCGKGTLSESPRIDRQVGPMKDFRRWLESQGKTPAQCTRKRKLMALARGEGGSDESEWGLAHHAPAAVPLPQRTAGRPATRRGLGSSRPMRPVSGASPLPEAATAALGWRREIGDAGKTPLQLGVQVGGLDFRVRRPIFRSNANRRVGEPAWTLRRS